MTSPLVLAFDTTQQCGSLALARGDNVLEEVELRCPEGFSGVIFGEITRLLERHSVKLSEVEVYAVAAGPGSFTGVRVGLTAAKGLAEMHGRPVIAVSNLTAVAWLARQGDGALLAPVLDARRGEIAGAVYSRDLKRLLEPIIATPADFAARIAQFGAAVWCGPEALRFAPPGVPTIVTPQAMAAAIARLAAVAGGGQDAALADAEYVRRPDIRKNW